MTQNTTRIYPGLKCTGVEFFNDDTGLKAFAGGEFKDFQNLSYGIHEVLREAKDREPKTKKLLKKWHPESEIKQLEKFASCRYGALDFTPDIKDLKLQPGEYWDCPFRGNCEGEGIVCKTLMYHGNTLTPTDIKAIRLLSTTKTNDVISEELSMPKGTFNVFKQQLYIKLGNVQTKQEVALIGVHLNIL